MLIAEMYIWWFSAGWAHLAATLFAKMGDALSFFSLRSLIRTLFAPYRQISATSTSTSFLTALGDRLVSRLVGFTVRLLLMIVGIAVFITEAIVFLTLLIFWPFVPFLPIVGLALSLIGVSL